MKATLLLLLLYLVNLSICQVCTLEYKNAISPDCTDLTRPYCIQSNIDVNNTQYNCVQCVNDCDCGIGLYCSSNRWENQAGTCINFGAEGNDCVPMDGGSLSNIKIDSKWKCADIVSFDGEIVFVDGPGSGNVGAKQVSSICVNAKCRACDPSRNDPNVWDVNCRSGLGVPRTCVQPGVWSQVGNVNWLTPEYYQDPTRVWLAIYFPFLIIGLCTSCCMLFRRRLSQAPMMGQFLDHGSVKYTPFPGYSTLESPRD